jgi:hypothetical protein
MEQELLNAAVAGWRAQQQRIISRTDSQSKGDTVAGSQGPGSKSAISMLKKGNKKPHRETDTCKGRLQLCSTPNARERGGGASAALPALSKPPPSPRPAYSFHASLTPRVPFSPHL